MHTHETQSRRESCVFSFNHLILYTALHKRVLSTLKQCLLQFLTIIIITYHYYYYLLFVVRKSFSIETSVRNVVLVLLQLSTLLTTLDDILSRMVDWQPKFGHKLLIVPVVLLGVF